MTYGDFRDSLHDVGFTLATPFDETGDAVLHDELAANAEALQAAGANVFIPCGNTGEYYSLSHDERIAVVETVADAVGSDGTVIGGAGGSTKTTLDLVDAYEDAGVDGVMVMYPSHTYVNQDGAVEYYRRIADATNLPVVLYKRGPALSDDALCELSTVENVAAVKYAVDDSASFLRVVSEVPGDVTWINGIAERFALSYAMEGADGFTTGIGNALPEPVLALSSAIQDEDWERAREIRDAIRPLEDLRAETGPNNDLSAANNVPVVKHCMEVAGLYGGPVREPLVELSEEDADRAESRLETVRSLDLSTPATAD